jgi:hypothetical protein
MRWYLHALAAICLSCGNEAPLRHSEIQRDLNGPSCTGDAVTRATCISQFCRSHVCDGKLRQDGQGASYQYEPDWNDLQALFDAAGQETGISARLLKAIAYGEGLGDSYSDHMPRQFIPPASATLLAQHVQWARELLYTPRLLIDPVTPDQPIDVTIGNDDDFGSLTRGLGILQLTAQTAEITAALKCRYDANNLTAPLPCNPGLPDGFATPTGGGRPGGYTHAWWQDHWPSIRSGRRCAIAQDGSNPDAVEFDVELALRDPYYNICKVAELTNLKLVQYTDPQYTYTDGGVTHVGAVLFFGLDPLTTPSNNSCRRGRALYPQVAGGPPIQSCVPENGPDIDHPVEPYLTMPHNDYDWAILGSYDKTKNGPGRSGAGAHAWEPIFLDMIPDPNGLVTWTNDHRTARLLVETAQPPPGDPAYVASQAYIDSRGLCWLYGALPYRDSLRDPIHHISLDDYNFRSAEEFVNNAPDAYDAFPPLVNNLPAPAITFTCADPDPPPTPSSGRYDPTTQSLRFDVDQARLISIHRASDPPADAQDVNGVSVLLQLFGALFEVGVQYLAEVAELDALGNVIATSQIPFTYAASFYSCDGGTDFCGVPVTGTPDQVACGLDGTNYQCTPGGWLPRPDLGACDQDCASDSPSYTCPDLAWSNACGEPQSGRQQQLACNPYDDVYQCVHGPDDAADAGHWELRWIGGCLQALGQTCAAAPTSFYACPDGTDVCGAPITGAPNQISCGLDAARYQCTPGGWLPRPDLGPCSQDCSSSSASFSCPDLAWSNACGEPQSGVGQQLACNPYNDVYQCVHGADDASDAGHWELRWIGDCLDSLGQTCTAPATSFYTCPGGTDFCGAPVTGVPGQIGCGADGARYQCSPDGWRVRTDLGSCTQACLGTGYYTCDESPGLCWEPQTGVQQELNCTPYNDVMQCVQGPGDPPDRGHWEVQWLGNCDALTGRTCSNP